MSCDDTSNRVWWIALVLCIALGVWVLMATEVLAPASQGASVDDGVRIENADLLASAPEGGSTHGADLASDPQGVARVSVPGRGTLTVTVVGPHDTPLPQVPVILSEDLPGKPEGRSEEGKTDDSGRVLFSDVPFGGTARVGVVRVLTGGTIQPVGAAQVTSSTLRLRIGVGLPLTVRVLDSLTGVQRPGILGGWLPAFADGAWDTSPNATLAALGPYFGARLQLRMNPRDDYVGRTTVWRRFALPPDVRRLHFVVPLHREAGLVLVAAAGGQLPKAKPVQAEITVGRHAFGRGEFEVDGFGRVCVPGIPFRQHVPVGAHVVFADGSHGVGRTRMGSGDSTDVVIELDIQPSPDGDETLEEEVTEQEITEEVEFNTSHSPVPGAATGQLTLKLRRVDGPPAAGVWAVLAKADGGGPFNRREANQDGVVHWEHIRPGAYQVHIWGVGATIIQDVEVRADGEATYELHGASGGRLKVTVRDQAGNALPFAFVRVTDSPSFLHSDVRQDGQQRIDPYTDHDGTRTFHRIRPGEVDVHVTYAGYQSIKQVDVRAGHTAELDVVLDLSR